MGMDGVPKSRPSEKQVEGAFFKLRTIELSAGEAGKPGLMTLKQCNKIVTSHESNSTLRTL